MCAFGTQYRWNGCANGSFIVNAISRVHNFFKPNEKEKKKQNENKKQQICRLKYLWIFDVCV